MYHRDQRRSCAEHATGAYSNAWCGLAFPVPQNLAEIDEVVHNRESVQKRTEEQVTDVPVILLQEEVVRVTTRMSVRSIERNAEVPVRQKQEESVELCAKHEKRAWAFWRTCPRNECVNGL